MTNTAPINQQRGVLELRLCRQTTFSKIKNELSCRESEGIKDKSYERDFFCFKSFTTEVTSIRHFKNIPIYKYIQPSMLCVKEQDGGDNGKVGSPSLQIFKSRGFIYNK